MAAWWWCGLLVYLPLPRRQSWLSAALDGIHFHRRRAEYFLFAAADATAPSFWVLSSVLFIRRSHFLFPRFPSAWRAATLIFGFTSRAISSCHSRQLFRLSPGSLLTVSTFFLLLLSLWKVIEFTDYTYPDSGMWGRRKGIRMKEAEGYQKMPRNEERRTWHAASATRQRLTARWRWTGQVRFKVENVPVSQQSGNLGQGRRRAIQTLVLVSDSLERQGNERSSLFYSFLLRRSTSSISETHICGRGFGYKVDGVALNSRDCVCGGPFSGQGSIDRRLNCGNSKTRNSEKFFGKKKMDTGWTFLESLDGRGELWKTCRWHFLRLSSFHRWLRALTGFCFLWNATLFLLLILWMKFLWKP